MPKSLSTFKGAPVSEVVSIIAKKTHLSIHRIKVTDDATGKTLAPEDKVDKDMHMTIKDLGPQVSWRTVFLCEYGGPLVIHPLIYYAWTAYSGTPRSSAQLLTMLMIVLHFVKREYETIYVHRFSAATMPIMNIFKNCAYYWLVGGVTLAAVTYSDFFNHETYAFPKVAGYLYVFSELANYKTHCILRDLRPAGTKERKIPRGFGFDWVSCPNYFFEIMAWCAISSVTMSWSSWLFTAMGATQMWFWSVKKHRRYKKEFKDYPRERKILIPFVL